MRHYKSSTQLNSLQLESRLVLDMRYAIGAQAGGGPRVEVISENGSTLANFYAYDPSFTGGVRVAMGDVNGDGVMDLITVPGPGGGPQVNIYDGASGYTRLLYSFWALGSQNSGDRGGTWVTTGDLDGNGTADVIVSGWDATAGQPAAYMYNSGNPAVGIFQGKVYPWSSQAANVPYGQSPYVGGFPITTMTPAGWSHPLLMCGNPGGWYHDLIEVLTSTSTYTTVSQPDVVSYYPAGDNYTPPITYPNLYSWTSGDSSFDGPGYRNRNRATANGGTSPNNYELPVQVAGGPLTDAGDVILSVSTTNGPFGALYEFNTAGAYNYTAHTPFGSNAVSSMSVVARTLGGYNRLIVGSGPGTANSPIDFLDSNLNAYYQITPFAGFNGGVWVG